MHILFFLCHANLQPLASCSTPSARLSPLATHFSVDGAAWYEVYNALDLFVSKKFTISMQTCPTDYCKKPLNMYQIKMWRGRAIALLSVACLDYIERIRIILFFLCHHLSVRFSHTRCSNPREKTSSSQSDIFKCVDTYPMEWFYRRWCHSKLQPEWSSSPNSIYVIMNIFNLIASKTL